MSPFIDAELAADQGSVPIPDVRRRPETDARVAEISSLLSALEEAANESSASPAALAQAVASVRANPVAADNHENRLAQVRLGMAGAMFVALRQKHSPTASHSLRVALGCSTWALYKRLDDETRDVVELAALLHDIGKIGVPDAILSKTTPLDEAESAVMEQHWEMGLQILASCCSSPRILDAVLYTGARFEGGRGDVRGDRIPLEARMIAIVDAFDTLTATTGEALSRAQALQRLSAGAGSLFDPILVQQFIELLSHDQDALTRQVAGLWFGELGKHQSQLPWSCDSSPAPEVNHPAGGDGGQSLFVQQLIDATQDGVVFVDPQSSILLWSKGAERLTGVSSAAATGRVFLPSLLDMCNSAGRHLRDDACPVARALSCGSQLRQRLEILGRNGGRVAIDLHAIPVYASNGELQGGTVLLHDAESEATLEEKCEALHAEVTKDPMTKVANRAEFDRMQELFMETHQQAGLPCSLIMTDIDHFKSINDTYGHQAGDEAIITVATLLKQMCRSGDLVARYGGEEFAVLCADCSAEDAARRAEQIRRKLSETPHSALGNKRITASFGVAQLQRGDTAESMLRRADLGLLTAKERGRNQVIVMGEEMNQQQKKQRWWSFGALRPQPISQTVLCTQVPIDIAIEKLRGFVTDQGARTLWTRDKRVEIELSTDKAGLQRRTTDRPMVFRIEIEFGERRQERRNSAGLAAGLHAETIANVAIRPRRSRNRRTREQMDHAALILQRLKSYMMAKEIGPSGDDSEVEVTAAR